jgi:hypothetical protein
MAGLLDYMAGRDEGAPQAPPSIPDRSGFDFPDVARSFGSGLVKGTGMLLGLPGDVRQMIADAHDTYIRPIEQRLGYQGPSPEQMREIYARQSSVLPTSPQLADKAQAVFGQPYQPQTDAGDVARVVGEKLPSVPLYMLTRGRGAR